MLPTTKIGDLEVTRLIIGGNPFSGHSHMSAERTKEMVDYHTVDRIKQTLREAEQAGINACVGRADNHVMRLLNEYWNEGGGISWIAQTAPERASVPANVDQAAAIGAKACFLHGGMIDNMYRAGRLAEAREWIQHIKDKGIPAGLASHDPEILRAAEEMELGAEFYMTCFYNVYLHGEVYRDEDRDGMTDLVRQLDKVCLAYKILAAGRRDPEEAFEYAYGSIKPADAVVVGIYTKHQPTQIADDVALALRFMSAEAPARTGGQ
ncbi:MAG: hypothetical protein PVH68_15665 [Armatimonadota bacterium]